MLSLREQTFFYWYFIIHIPITLLIDSSVVLPDRFQYTRPLVEWHIAQNNDFLLFEKPLWLQYFVWVEMVAQLPGFFWFIAKFRQLWALQDHKHKKQKAAFHKCQRSLSKWLTIYGWNASITTFICIYTVWVRGYYPFAPFIAMLTTDKLKLIGLYVPYLLLPLYLVLFS